jgi:CheY-like chemotaxis protein
MKSICIIDDDSIYLMLVNRIIATSKLSDDVIEFGNGKDAFDALRQMHLFGDNLPDIILLDLNMPIWDGWDFLDEFSGLKLPEYPEVYIITSSTDSMEREKALSYPMVKGFISKPIHVEALAHVFRGGQEANQEK